MAIFITPGGGATPGGSDKQLQFNEGGTALGGSSNLTYDKMSSKLTNKGDVNLDDGSNYVTTLQAVTPTANRTITLPDATGTIGLVAGSNSQLVWNSSGAYSGVSNSTVDSSGNITIGGRFIDICAAAASLPPISVSGTWYTGGTATTTKPQVIIEPIGTTSTGWNTAGTGLGVNAPSGFSGNLLDLQVNGSSHARIQPGFVGLGRNNATVVFAGGLDTNEGPGTSCTVSGFKVRAGGSYSFSSDINTPLGTTDVSLFRDAPGILAQRVGTAAQVFRVYNTYTNSSNYELGKLEWFSNVLRIGTEKGSGGGTARAVEIHTDSLSRLALDTIGSVRLVTGLTVNTLPTTPTVGMIARVTDATAPAVGSAVTGGGATNALCWYNGTTWNVLGV